jgi:hypothetical protein
VRYNVRSSDCTRPPPFGTPIRFSTGRLQNGEISYYNGWGSLDLPLDNPELNRALLPYAGTVESKEP